MGSINMEVVLYSDVDVVFNIIDFEQNKSNLLEQNQAKKSVTGPTVVDMLLI